MNASDLHDGVWSQLCARRARLPHALLFAGQRGIGKFALARGFADLLLCEGLRVADQACGKCVACRWTGQGSHPDFRLLQPQALAVEEGDAAAVENDAAMKKKPSQQITIDQVRELDDFLHLGTHRHGARIVLICPAEAMNRATANALLKSLEEPIADTLFMLVSHELHRLLPTIRSRCQTITVTPPELPAAVRWLKLAGIDEAEKWLALAGGSPLLACDLATSGERSLLDALLEQMARGERCQPLAAAAQLDKVIKAEKRPFALKRTIEWAQKWLVDLTLVGNACAPRYFITETAALRRLAAATDTLRLLAFARKAIQYKAECEQPLNARLFLEDFFLRYERLFAGHPRIHPLS